MNKYKFKHPLQAKERIVTAGSFREANEVIMADNNGDSWLLIAAWDRNDKMTYDFNTGIVDLPPVCS